MIFNVCWIASIVDAIWFIVFPGTAPWWASLVFVAFALLVFAIRKKPDFFGKMLVLLSGPLVIALTISPFFSASIFAFVWAFCYGVMFACFIGDPKDFYRNIGLSLLLVALFLGISLHDWLNASWLAIAFCVGLLPSALIRRYLFS